MKLFQKLGYVAIGSVLTMALCLGALAATGQVSFNLSAVQFNGTQISARGESYTLTNGQSVPSSITYTDEKGGGTTYLPIRRISELMGVEIGYDAGKGAVTIAGDALQSPDPTPTAPSTDYSNWSAEEEAAYQEFKGLWEIKFKDSGDRKYHMNGSYDETPWESYTLNGTLPYIEAYSVLASANQQGFINRLAYELRSSNVMVEMYFISKEGETMPFVIK